MNTFLVQTFRRSYEISLKQLVDEKVKHFFMIIKHCMRPQKRS